MLDQMSTTGTEIAFNWPSAPGATEYDVKFGRPRSPFWKTVQGLQNPIYVITGLKPGERYAAKVRAVDAVDRRHMKRGPWSTASLDLYTHTHSRG